MRDGVDYLSKTKMKIIKLLVAGEKPSSISKILGISEAAIRFAMRTPMVDKVLKVTLENEIEDRIRNIKIEGYEENV